ncbi:MAG: diguanylate cyclase, partial [Pseudazoarcus pumilus]|nr:diguanylate cyclase [Pseudazoarcus pumilus]
MAAQRKKGEDAAPPSALRQWWRGMAVPLNLAVLLVCAVLVGGIWLATLQRMAFEREQAVVAEMQSNANLAIAFEQQVFRTLKAAEQVAAFVRVQYLQRGKEIDLSRWVADGTIRETLFTIISVVDETGTVVSSSQATGAVNYADRDFFQRQRELGNDELFVNQPVFGRVSKRWQIPMSLRITRVDGSFGGVVVMSVDPDNFTDFYRQADLGRRGLLELTGLDGVMRGRKVGSEGSFGLDARAMPWFDRQAGMPAGSLLDDGTALDGVPRVVSYRRMAGYPLMVVVGTPVEDALQPVWQRSRGYVLAAGTATLVLLVFAALLMLVLARQRRATQGLQASEALFR